MMVMTIRYPTFSNLLLLLLFWSSDSIIGYPTFSINHSLYLNSYALINTLMVRIRAYVSYRTRGNISPRLCKPHHEYKPNLQELDFNVSPA